MKSWNTAVTGDRHEAEEIMQDAFLRLWERWDDSRIDDPSAYLFRTAMNVFRNRYRRSALGLRRTLSITLSDDAFANVDDRDLDVLGEQPHPAVEQLAQHAGLAGALLEPAQAHGAGVEQHRLGVDAGDPAHRHEDAAALLDLDDEAERPRGVLADAQRDDDVPHAAHLVAVRVEHREPGQPRDEDAG